MTDPHVEPVAPLSRSTVRLIAGLDLLGTDELAAVLYALTAILASLIGAWIAHQLRSIVT